ncbi:DUF1553 domain-containing protein [bacterium]|nr:DUF1553 domain-containing protein [bacterium]
MRFPGYSAALLLVTCMMTANSDADEAANPLASSKEGLEFFESKIRPVLVRECYECHSAESKSVKGGLRLDSRKGTLDGGDSGPSIVPGVPAESMLLSAIRYEDMRMPPKRKLPDSVAADFERWIRMGAPDSREAPHASEPASRTKAVNADFWAFRPPVAHEAPKVSDPAWARDDIDRFVLARLEEKSLMPADQADRRTWLRRVTFDLTGLPPEPEDVERFEADKSTDAYEKVVDNLLASPHYGERWGRHWLDLARYAEDQAHTFKARMYPNGYLYRDWVVRALNDDMPYDRFLKYQIAADLLDEPDIYANRAALGLFALGPVYYQDNGEKDKALADEWDDRLDTLMRGTQAMTVACARCHDHKYDPIAMSDYYGLAGVFASSEYAELPAVADSVVEARRKADEAAADAELTLNRRLAELAPDARAKAVDRIPDYAVAAWRLGRESRGDQSKAKAEKALRDAAASTGLNVALLARWVKLLTTDSAMTASGEPSVPGRGLSDFRSQFPERDSSPEEQSAAEKELRRIAGQWRDAAKTALPHRAELTSEFGQDFAFVKPEDRAKVAPGMIPLGNLFGDRKDATLASAVGSDRFLAVATKESLGVQQILQGWGDTAQIAPGIRLSFSPLGSDANKHGEIVNDGWSAEGGIRTTGKAADPKIGRTEQGIGMHANALITFDLNAIRRAGLIPAAKTLRFVVDRAGINDDAFGQGEGVNLAVIVSRPQTDRSRFDSILSAHVNGKPVRVIEDDTLYKFMGAMPPKIKADGTFVRFELPLPPEAQYLTLVSTAAGKPDDANSISSDHAVFSGVRIEYQPDSADTIAARASTASDKTSDADRTLRAMQARLLSELFDEQGLLGMPAAEIEPLLDGDVATQVKTMRHRVDTLRREAAAIQVPRAHTLTDGSARDLKIYLAGDPKRTGAIAPRRFPAAWSGPNPGKAPAGSSGRLELAEAIASASNPLTARVIVNRIWAGHFGTGLVRTLNNFGQLGDRPSHPELLDTLAVDFIKSGWSMKGLHRRIVLSATYRQSSRAENSAAIESDPENRLLWRMNRRRLEIEPWRDAVLAISGELDPSFGGPSVPLDENNRRRTLYGFVSRHRLNDLLRLFDFPDPNITAGERSITTVPLQQLFVLNSDFMVRQSKALAARLTRERTTDTERIDRAFRLIYGRSPAESEKTAAVEFLADSPKSDADRLTPLEQMCLALLGTNELVYLD